MILHRRIHKFVSGKFDEGIELAMEFRRVGQEKLGVTSRVYRTDLHGGPLPRGRLIIDNLFVNLAAIDDYYQAFFALPELAESLARWKALEEESWAENYVLLAD